MHIDSILEIVDTKTPSAKLDTFVTLIHTHFMTHFTLFTYMHDFVRYLPVYSFGFR